MIAKMREIAPIFIVIALVAFMATIFLDWGMDFTGLGNRPVAGTIEGKRVSMEAFDRMVNAERQRLEREQPGDMAPDQSRLVPQQVWERLVQEELMGKQFKAMRLGASADETWDYMRRNPPPGIDTMEHFKTNGVYDTAKYEQFLSNPAIYDNPGWRELELHTRRFIIPTNKLQVLLRAGAVPSKLELSEICRQRNQKAVFEYAYVPSRDSGAGGPVVTDDMIKRYYSAHTDSFKAPEQVELYYVSLPKAATANDEATYQQELTEIKERVRSKQSTFAEEAGLSDDEATAAKGGDLGWFGKGAMAPEFEQAAFTANVGEVVGPFRTQFGFHLLVVEEKRTEKGQEQVHARHILRKIQPSLETLDSLKGILDSVITAAREEGLKKAADSVGLRADSTGLVAKGAPIPRLGYISGVNAFAFTGAVGEVGENVYEDLRGFYVFEIKRKERAGVLPLEDVRHKIQAVLADSIGEQAARARLSGALAKLPSGSPLTELTKLDPAVRTGVSDSVSLMQYVPPLGFGCDALAMAFAVDIGKVSGIAEAQGGVAAVRPLWRSPVESETYDSPALSAVKSAVESADVQRLYMDWYTNYKAAARVKKQYDRYYLD